MQISLKGPNGDVIQSYHKGNKAYVNIAGLEYEVSSPIDEFDEDPEIRDMIEASERDILNGKAFSSEAMMEAIKRVEL